MTCSIITRVFRNFDVSRGENAQLKLETGLTLLIPNGLVDGIEQIFSWPMAHGPWIMVHFKCI